MWRGFTDVATGFLTSPELAISFPYHTRLLKIGVILPLGTACVERSFSKLKLIKTRLRASLHEQHLDALLMLALELPFDSVSGIPDPILAEIVEGFRKERQDPDCVGDARHRQNRFATFDHYKQLVGCVLAKRQP